MNLGKSIKYIRNVNCLNQKDYASRLGITQSYLSLLESGNKKPSVDLLESIAEDSKIPLPILLWFSIDEKDIEPKKKELFKLVRPSIDSLINSIM